MTFLKLLKALFGYSPTGIAKSSDASNVEGNIQAEGSVILGSAQSVLESKPITGGQLMTEPEAKRKLVDWCKSQIGYHEGYDGSNKYADGQWDTKLYGFSALNVPWCDVFVDAAYISCFGFDDATTMTYQKPSGYAACSLSADAYKRNGAFFNTPEIGDQIFFFYGGAINHTGIVIDVQGDTAICVEGNYSDGVARTQYKTNDRIIAGYGRPKWSVVSDGSTEEPSKDPVCDQKMWQELAAKMPDVRYGNIGDAVKALQAMFNVLGANLDVDGECGVLTETEIRNFQGGRL